MRSRLHRRSALIGDLRLAIDCLPSQTRVAMLEGVRANEIIVGAYVDRRGGVCPMLAAHRCGGRTDFLTFARTWDRFTGARGHARRATEREVNILVAHLEASLLAEHSLDFEHAIAEHRKLVASQSGERPTPRPAPRPGERVRPREHDPREGWAWLRVFRRLDDYERALSRVQAEREGLLAEHAELGTQERERASA